MSNSATGLENAWRRVIDVELTEAQKKDLQRRRSEDFHFMLVCAAKGNMGMYDLLRDRSLDSPRKS